MTSVEQEERLVLEQARHALGPTSADESRVLAAVSRAIALGGGPPTAPGPSPGDLPRKEGHPNVSSSMARLLSSLVAIGAVVAAGGIGHQIGWHAGFDQGRASVAVTAAGSRAVPQDSAPPVVPPPAGSEPTAPVATGEPARPVSSARSSARPDGTLAPGRAASTEEEISQIRRVERALRANNPRLALVLLDELDRSVPGGKLKEERAAARVIASCGLGIGPPQVLADDFARTRTGSVYLPRVRRACAAE